MLSRSKFILFIFIISSVVSFADTRKDPAQNAKNTFTLTAVGDIMMGSHFPSTDDLPADDGVSLFHDVTPFFNNSDIVFANLEGPLVDDGECVKKCKNPETCYAFKMPERYAAHLVKTGFNLIGIANNHIGDFGKTGIQKTADTLSKAGIHYAGILFQPNTIFELNGKTIGFCAFSHNLATPDSRDLSGAKRVVELVSGLCDIVIVSVHAGGEGEKNRHVTRQTEIYHDEDRGNVYAFAHTMIDAGADVVLGHGPHVTRAMELYKGHFIAYSLGNFCTYGRFNLKSHNGIAPIVRLTLNNRGEFISGQITSIFQLPRKGPSIDPKKRALNDVIELTTQDFPENDLVINPSGELTIKPR